MSNFVTLPGNSGYCELTYEELKKLRDDSQLVSGMQYRITDYACTTTQADTSIAGHAFDIIVTADSETELNENAYAAQHSGDTYFQTCNLNAWKLKYCLDNDIDRFAWADATNGKGVIYYMKDECSNECPYDFKNIMFTVSGTNYYTFDAFIDSVHHDFSVAQTSKSCYGNIIKEYRNTNNNVFKLTLGRNIFKNTSLSSVCYSNILKNNCYSNTFGNNCRENMLGNNCQNNTFGNYYQYSSFGNSCYGNSFGDSCQYNTFGDYCFSNSIGNNCDYNSFRNHCYGNRFWNYCQNITVFDGVKFCNILGGTSAEYVQNAQILSGTQGASDANKLSITFSKKKNYTQVAGLVNGTDLRIWIAEDTVTGTTSSADGNIAIFDGTSGKMVKDSGLQISDLTNMVETTWFTLKLLKESSNLVPGKMYRITDYNTTVSEALTDVSVAGHQFDIIVTALSKTELDCRASAIQHEGDTYFSNCDLSKWQLWYDIENDTDKYSWAVGYSSSGNGGAKGSISGYAPEYISADKTTAINLDKAGLSNYLVFQGIETITMEKEDVECYVYGTSVQAAALGYTKIFCQEYPSLGSEIYGIDSKENIVILSDVITVSSSMQPTNGTKIIAKSITSDHTAHILNKAGISPELEFNGRIVMYRGQKCYSYGSSAQYAVLANEFKNITDIIVTDGVSPNVPKKVPGAGAGVIILDDEVGDSITAVSQEMVVLGGNGGTGVIYRMIDEWGNDCPYDFKNIKFQRWAVTACSDCPSLVVDSSDNTYGYYYGAYYLNDNEEQTLEDATYGENFGWFYTFALKELNSGDWYDYTVVANLGLKDDRGHELACYNNHIDKPVTDEYLSGKGEMVRMLNNIVFFNCYWNLSDTSSSEYYSHCNNNHFFGNCNSNTFGNNCYGNTFGNMCLCNTFGNECSNNSFKNNCTYNSFGNNCTHNSFGNGCYGNSLDDGCYSNSFENSCRNNTLGTESGCNAFGNGGSSISFGNSCYGNSAGNYCNNISFGNSCYGNSIGNNCYSVSFGNNCTHNLFGNICIDTIIGNSCSYNSYGNNCANSQLGDNCLNNSFGDNCYNDSLLSNCENNSFGNGCRINLFFEYCQSITVFEGVQFCNITGGTNAAPVKNAQILNGTKGVSNTNRLTITFTANQNYTQIAGLNSSGVLKIWTPADLID
jgi:hypothetical protein